MRTGKANGHEWLRLAEAAAVLGVSHNTLRHWSDTGHVCCYRSPGGHRRYRRSDLDALLGMSASSHGLAERPGEDTTRDSWLATALDALVGVAARGTGTTSCCLAVQEGEDLLRVVAAHGDCGTQETGATLPLSTLPVEAEVVHSRRRLHIPDVARSHVLAGPTTDDYCRRGLLGLLVLPIQLDDGRMGVLRLGDSRGPHPFDSHAMTFAELMAGHAGILLSDTPPRAPVERGTMDATADFVRPLVSPGEAALHGGDALERVARAAIGALGHRPEVRTCTIYALDGGRAHALASSACSPVEDWDLDELRPGIAAAADNDVELVLRDDARLDAAARMRFFDARRITGLALASITCGGQAVGMIEAGGIDPGALSGLAPVLRDVATLVSVTMQMGADQAHLRGRERGLAMLQDAWQQDTSRISAEQVLRGLVERVAATNHAPIAEIYAVEGNTARALVSYDGGRWDKDWEDIVLRLDRYPTSQRAVETGDVVIVNSLDEAMLDQVGRFSLERWGYQSHLSVPLVAGGRTLGLLDVYDYVPHDFCSDLETTRGLAHIAATTLDNERLAEQGRRRSRMIEELEVIAGLCAAATDPGLLAAAVAERLRAALDAASCQLLRLTPQGVLCMAAHDRSGRDSDAVGLLADLSDYPTTVNTMNAKDILVISSPQDERLTPSEQAEYRARGWASEICTPLVLQDRLLGFIDVLDSHPRGFAEYTDFMRTVAGMVSVALETARLRDELARRTGDLESLTVIGGLDVRADPGGEVLEHIAAEIRRRLEAADCDVFAFDEGGLHCLVSVDEGGRDSSVSTAPLDVDRFPATAQAVRSGDLVVVPDLDDPRLSDQERADMAQWGFQSEACIPLVEDGRVLGIIDIFDSRPRDFAEHRAYLAAAGRVATGIVAAVLADRDGRRRHVAEAPWSGPQRREDTSGATAEPLA